MVHRDIKREIENPAVYRDLLVRPFPEAGPSIVLAYNELNKAATLNEAEKKEVGYYRMPRPWIPSTCAADPDLRMELWEWLEAVVVWMNTQYTWNATMQIPACWPYHPHIVNDLATVADIRRRCEVAPVSDSLEEWHKYTLPQFFNRMRERMGQQNCETGHGEWPGGPRHKAHIADADETSKPSMMKVREELFSLDLDALKHLRKLIGKESVGRLANRGFTLHRRPEDEQGSRAAATGPAASEVTVRDVDTSTGEVVPPRPANHHYDGGPQPA
jgi:hypothetical protein